VSLQRVCAGRSRHSLEFDRRARVVCALPSRALLMAESIFAALLAGNPQALGLLPGRFQDPAAWCAAADVASRRAPAPTLLAELRRQNAEFSPSPARDRNLERLAQPGTTVVVTGQQVGLFGGPLYTLHKAATCIVRAKQVAAWTGRPVVPVFWLQTEDHDYPEISRVTVLAPSGPFTVTLPPDPEPSRISIAHRVLPQEVSGALSDLELALGPLPHAAEVLAALDAHYVPGRSLGAAFAGLMADLFKEEGLVVIDPRVPAIARLAAPVLEEAIHGHETLAQDLAARAAAIREAGCEEQIRTRPEASLVFFHPIERGGARYRLVRQGGDWETPAGSVAHGTLTELLATDPLRFSTSALLRPLVQDTLLPTCAYVGGPAEVSYFAQLAPVYTRLGVPMPLIAPRVRLRLLDGSTRSLLRKLGLEAKDVNGPRSVLLARVEKRPEGAPTAALLRERLLAPLERELDALAALELPALGDAIRRARESSAHVLGKLADRAERAAIGEDEVTRNRLDRLINALCPGDVPQERAYGFAALGAHVGLKPLLHAILEGATSLDPAVHDVPL
jgi:bacillithiol biosynthesis cysteine-adding enzyme BshC